jgi:type I restriction enzyme R subunit
LDTALTKSFWTNITYEDAQRLMTDFGPLMKYKRSEPRPSIILDIDDVVERRELIEYGPTISPKSAYVEDYREKVEKRIKKLAEEHPTIQKIKHNEPLTEEDLQKLEQTLNSQDLFITEVTLQKAYKRRGTLVEFIKSILGLYRFPDPGEKIEEAFKTFMIEKNYLNADQVNFLRTMQTMLTKKHHIEFSELYEPPFTNFGPKAPIPLFRKEELDEVLKMCKSLEVEVLQHA